MHEETGRGLSQLDRHRHKVRVRAVFGADQEQLEARVAGVVLRRGDRRVEDAPQRRGADAALDPARSDLAARRVLDPPRDMGLKRARSAGDVYRFPADLGLVSDKVRGNGRGRSADVDDKSRRVREVADTPWTQVVEAELDERDADRISDAVRDADRAQWRLVDDRRATCGRAAGFQRDGNDPFAEVWVRRFIVPRRGDVDLWLGRDAGELDHVARAPWRDVVDGPAGRAAVAGVAVDAEGGVCRHRVTEDVLTRVRGLDEETGCEAATDATGPDLCRLTAILCDPHLTDPWLF